MAVTNFTVDRRCKLLNNAGIREGPSAAYQAME